MLARARKRPKSPQRRKSKDRQNHSSDSDNYDDRLANFNIRWLYVFFLSARNLHVPVAFCCALASSVGLFTLSMTFGTPYTT